MTESVQRRASLEVLRAEAADELAVLIQERLLGGEDPWEFSHEHADGTLGRTTPAACVAASRDMPVTSGFGLAGVRPPYMHPARMRELHLPR